MKEFSGQVRSLFGPILAAVFLILPLIASSAYAQSKPDGASLTEAEQWIVLEGAFATGAANGATSLAEAQALRQEVLLVNLVTEDGNQARAGTAYIYDYTTDTLNVATVDLESGQPQSMESLVGVQLPLTLNEIGRAVQIAIGNEEILTQTETAYQEMTGESFTMLDQIAIDATIFLAASMPSLINMQSAECGIHRCAIVTMQTRDGKPIPIQPVVDLSAQTVVQNITEPTAIVSPPGNLGFVDTGQIVDDAESAEIPTGTAVGAAIGESPATVGELIEQGNLGVADTGMILDEAATPSQNEVTGQVAVAPSHRPSNAEGSTIVAGTTVAGTTVAGTTIAGVEPTTTPGSAKVDIFIPIVARRSLKKSAESQEIEFNQAILVDWWCNIVQDSPLADEIHHLCQP